MEKIPIKATLKEAFTLYRKNFKSLTAFSLIYALLTMSLSLSPFLAGKSKGSILMIALAGLLMIFVYVLLLIIVPRTMLGIQIHIAGIIRDEKPSVRNSFAKTKGRVAWLIANIMMLGLIFVPLELAATYLFTYLKSPLSFLATIPLNLLTLSAAYMLVPTIALEDSGGSKILQGLRLIKGNYARVIALVFLTTTLFTLPNSVLSQTVFKGDPLAILITAAVTSVILVITFAFAEVVRGIVYHQLSAQNASPEEPSEPSA